MSYRNSTRADRPSNRELRRRALHSMREGGKIYALFLAVLAQKGGEIVITEGTAQQVAQNMQHLGYIVKRNEDTKELTIVLTDDTPAAFEEGPTNGGLEELRDPVD